MLIHFLSIGNINGVKKLKKRQRKDFKYTYWNTHSILTHFKITLNMLKMYIIPHIYKERHKMSPTYTKKVTKIIYNIISFIKHTNMR